MPLHTQTARRSRLARAAVIACIATGATIAIAIADEEPTPRTNASAQSRQPVPARDYDIEANKAASMRALSLHLAKQRTDRASSHKDPKVEQVRTRRAR